jgi:uncharacterized protein
MIDASSFPVSVDPVALAAFCSRWRIAELAVFGSVLREDFGPDSDVDLLVTFDAGARHGLAGARHGLFALAEMELELEGLFGRDVDLVTRRSVEESANWIRKRAILDTAVPLEVQPPRNALHAAG